MLETLYDIMDDNVSIYGYQLTYLSLVALVLNFWSVGLAARNSAWTALWGMLGIIAFVSVCYDSRLYSEYFLQVFFFLGNICLLFAWNIKRSDGRTLTIRSTNPHLVLYTIAAWVIGTCCLGVNLDAFFITSVNIVLSMLTFITGEQFAYFYHPATFPFLEASTICGQVIAMILLVRRYIETWYVWITVYIMSAVLYALKGNIGISLIFCAFTLLSVYGLIVWHGLKQKAH